MFESMNNLTASADSDPLLSSLLWLELPGLDELEISEIYALRRNSDAYNEWRSVLARELVGVATLREQGYSAARVRDHLSEALTPTVHKLEKDLRNSSIKARVRDAGISLGITGVGSVAGLAVGGSPASSVTSAATVALVNLALGYFRGRQKASSDKALLGHFIALSGVRKR